MRTSRLATQPEFQKVWDLTFNKLGMKQQSSRSFSWTDRAVQPAYELIRQGKMPQSESLLGRTLNSLAAPGKKKGSRGSSGSTAASCPTSTSSARPWAPSTAAMTSEPDGWFIKGVLLTSSQAPYFSPS